MISNEFTIRHAVGLHARPASMFVQTAQKFSSKVTVTVGEKTINAKSILSLLGLGVTQGTTIKVTADGADEKEVLTALQQLIDSNFGE